MRHSRTYKSLGNKKESGTAALEFALVAMPTVFMMLGVVVVGINLQQAIEVQEICRSADSMYVRGVDFSQTSAQNLLVQLGQSMNLQTGSTSNGLIVLSQVQLVQTPFGCTSSCTGTSYQLMQRLTIGNTSLTGTHFPSAVSPFTACGGSTTTDCQDSEGNIQGYASYSGATISNFGSSLTLATAGQISYVAEAYFQNTGNLNIWSSPGFYAVSFF